MGGGVLAVAAGGVLGAMAKRKQRDAHDLCPDASMACDGAPRANELIRSGHNLAIEADIAFGVGAAAAITAGVLWLTSAPPGRIAVVPAASPEHIAVTARWSF